jgi:hypothetical protein
MMKKKTEERKRALTNLFAQIAIDLQDSSPSTAALARESARKFRDKKKA